MQDFINKYSIMYEIGSGMNGTVYAAVHKDSKQLVAMKKMDCSTENKMKMAKNEADILSALKSNYICKCIDRYDDEHTIIIVMEYAFNGSLCSIVHQGHPLREHLVYRYFKQICEAIQNLHNDSKVIHRDLKPENILLDESFNVKLIDFGLSRYFVDKSSEVEKEELIKTRCGTPYYLSPEVVIGQNYNEKSDIWSLGVILYWLSTGNLPFFSENIQKLFHLIIHSEVQFPDIEINPLLKNLITQLLEKDQRKRPSINKVMEHPWFTYMKKHTNQKKKANLTPDVDSIATSQSDKSIVLSYNRMISKQLNINRSSIKPSPPICNIYSLDKQISRKIPLVFSTANARKNSNRIAQKLRFTIPVCKSSNI